MSYLIEQAKRSKNYVIVGVLWLATVFLGIVSSLAARTMIIRTYLRFFPGEAQAAAQGEGALSLLNLMIVFPLALLFIAVVIGGFEYHYRRVGRESSWRLLARALAMELGILLLALYI
ncbi:MAG: hypothetical protein ACE5GO_10380 [Anaerolineales bacterium]